MAAPHLEIQQPLEIQNLLEIQPTPIAPPPSPEIQPAEPEIWKLIPRYEKYEASNLGRIRHHKHKRILTTYYNNGYEVLNLSGSNGTRKVHRLVATAFLPNPNNLPDADHLNGNKRDNRLCNLQWKSKSDNMKAFYANPEQRARKTASQAVLFYNDAERHVFSSIGKSAQHFERSLGTMWGVVVNTRENKTDKWRNYKVKLLTSEEYKAEVEAAKAAKATSQNAS